MVQLLASYCCLTWLSLTRLTPLMVADNGGPISDNGTSGANNWPLKGGKSTQWEGGIRVPAFISGGFLPEAVRGTKYSGLVTGWDWCTIPSVAPPIALVPLGSSSRRLGAPSQTGPSRSSPASTPRTTGPPPPACPQSTHTRWCRSFSARGARVVWRCRSRRTSSSCRCGASKPSRHGIAPIWLALLWVAVIISLRGQGGPGGCAAGPDPGGIGRPDVEGTHASDMRFYCRWNGRLGANFER